MKRFILTLFGLLIFASFGLVQAQNLNEVLEKHFKTIGQEKLTKVKTYTISAKVSQMGMDIPMIMKMKRPNKFRMEMDMQGQKMIQAFDGENGWMIAPWISSEPQELSGAQLQQAMDQADIDGELYNYEQKGSKAELVGKENLDGTDVFHIKLTSKNGNAKDYYIDADKNVVMMVKATVDAMGQTMEVKQKMSNFKDINGVVLATKIESENPMATAIIVFDEVKFDEDMDDSIFAKPGN